MTPSALIKHSFAFLDIWIISGTFAGNNSGEIGFAAEFIIIIITAQERLGANLK